MKQIKRRIEPFSFVNQSGIQSHLEKMAEKGWMIDKITNMGWVYRKIEPRNIKFAVSYYPKASEFDPEPSEGQKMFHDFCAYTGWELACMSAQLQIFYNEQENPIPIETEPALELQAIHASAKKSFLPAYFALLAVCIVQGLMFFFNLLGDPIELLASPTKLFTGLCFLILLVHCLVEIVGYLSWHSRAEKAAVDGAFISPPDTSLSQKIALIFVFAVGLYCLVNILFSGDPMRRWIMIFLCVLYPLLFVSVNETKEFLKRKKVSRGLNSTITFATCFLMFFLIIAVISAVILSFSRRGFFAKPEEETYEHNGMTWVIHRDELPLTVEDLMDIEYDGYIKQQSGDESLFLGKFELHQRPRFDAEAYGEIPALKYTIVYVKMPFLYDLCRDRMYSEQVDDYPHGRTYERVDAKAWGANEVYRRCNPGYGFDNFYLLCYDHVIVEIRFDWEPTSEQMAIVGEKLGA